MCDVNLWIMRWCHFTWIFCCCSFSSVFFFAFFLLWTFFFVDSFVWKSKCQDRAVQKERHFLCLVHALPAQRTENQPAIMLSTKKKKLQKKLRKIAPTLCGVLRAQENDVNFREYDVNSFWSLAECMVLGVGSGQRWPEHYSVNVSGRAINSIYHPYYEGFYPWVSSFVTVN